MTRMWLTILAILILWAGITYGLIRLQDSLHSKPKPTESLVYKSKGNLRVVRAVIGGRLAVLVFEYKDGVWFLGDSRWASDLKG